MPGQQSRQVDETRAAKHQPWVLRSARSLIGGLITCRKGSGNRSSPRPPHPGGLPAKNGLTPSRWPAAPLSAVDNLVVRELVSKMGGGRPRAQVNSQPLPGG